MALIKSRSGMFNDSSLRRGKSMYTWYIADYASTRAHNRLAADASFAFTEVSAAVTDRASGRRVKLYGKLMSPTISSWVFAVSSDSRNGEWAGRLLEFRKARNRF